MFNAIRHRSPYEETRALLINYAKGGGNGRRAIGELTAYYTPYELQRFALQCNGDNQIDAILRVAAKRAARII